VQSNALKNLFAECVVFILLFAEHVVCMASSLAELVIFLHMDLILFL